MAEEFVLVLTTLPAVGEDASRIAHSLIGARVAACVNVLGPMTSVYRWEEEIQEEAERQVIIKTTRGQLTALWELLREVHPYDVPEFVVLPIVDGSDAYLKWIGDTTNPEPA